MVRAPMLVLPRHAACGARVEPTFTTQPETV